MRTRILSWFAFAALFLLWLAATAIGDTQAPYNPKPYHKADGEPVNVAEIMKAPHREAEK